MSASGYMNMPEGALLALTWSGVGISGVFVLARMVVRFLIIRRFSDLVADDYWVIAAWLILLTNGVLQTLQSPHLYYMVLAAAGKVPAGQALLYHGTLYVRYEFVIISLFWTVLWCIKASFLSMYWRLFKLLSGRKFAWWGVVVFTFLTYVGDWISSVYTCHPPSDYFRFGYCTSPIDQRGSTISIAYTTTVDVLTDIMIMLLPISLLWKLRIPTRAKAGLAGIFSLAVIVVVIAIIRAVEITGKARSDPVWLAAWTVIESSISVIVGCLPAFKSFFKLRERNLADISRRRRQWEPYGRSSSRRSDFEQLSGSTPSPASRHDVDNENSVATQLDPIDVPHPDSRSSREEPKDPAHPAEKLGLADIFAATPSTDSQ